MTSIINPYEEISEELKTTYTYGSLLGLMKLEILSDMQNGIYTRASNNMDIPTLSARLGHADTNITNQYYVHSISSRDKIASDKIQQILS